ncbi:phosphoserine phosphatase SerB [Geminicoccaceae bacterium 1502E]|nr:phosphoserine phosphatase SerB [Geminicoccaceae bacterium 1502E]
MTAIVCLIADPARTPLAQALVREAAGAVKGEQRWLAPEEAVELASPLAPETARAILAPILEEAGCDWAVLPQGHRRKKLLISDMDSTMITVECIDELADYAGIKAQIAEVTRRAMNGEIEFATALRERVALLEGLPASVIEEVCRERLRAMPGARTLVATMRAHGAYTALVSGGFTSFTAHVRALLGFDMDEANGLEIAGGKLTGRLHGPLRDASSKLAALNRLIGERGLAREETLAVGDGANDLPMIQAAGLGVAFRAHPKVRAQAPVRVDHADLTGLLFLQGYTRGEFAA